ncbi:hypothetical protein AHAS_Ahas13G0346500 [Arachis hypogaea]
MEGKIELPLLSVPPDNEHIQLHTEGDQRSINFLKNIKRERKIVTTLKNMLDKYNSLAKNFYYARDSKKTTDDKTYNFPSASEVAALIVGDVEQLSKDRDIIIESQTRKLQRIDVFHPSYLALQYPLLFLYGEDRF